MKAFLVPFVILSFSSGASAKPAFGPRQEHAPLTVMQPPSNPAASVITTSSEFLSLPKDAIKCREIARYGKNVREDCTYQTARGARTIHKLTLTGTFAENAYAHGRLLSLEIEQGSLNEALHNIEAFEKTLKPLPLRAVTGLYQCYESRMIRAASDEFNEGVRQLHAGYIAGVQAVGRSPKFPEASSLVRATYSIEMGNLLGGIIHRFSGNFGSKTGAFLNLAHECGLKVASQVMTQLDEIMIEKGLIKDKFACTGVVGTPSWTKDGRLVHGRNLEQTAMINTWNNHPVVFLVDEKKDPTDKTAATRAYHRYVAFGTAGLIFPGGISGMNDQGITVSLHQFSTTAVDGSQPKKSAAMMPFLEQRILREASSIEEAQKIIESSRVFSGWTIFVGDARNNQVASFEITPKRITRTDQNGAVRARWNTGYMAQVNMYLNPRKQSEHFHGRYNNLLENTSRFTIATRKLRELYGKLDLAYTMNILADHEDLYEKGERTFGRSVARVSNIMSSIVIADPKSGKNEAYMTIADSYPAVQGFYAGFDVDFSNMKLTSKGAFKNGNYIGREDRENAFHEYHLAYKAYSSHTEEGLQKALVRLDAFEASNHAARVTDDPVFDYIKGRFALNIAETNTTNRLEYASIAALHFKVLESMSNYLHPLRKANVIMLGMRARELSGDFSLSSQERKFRFDFAKSVVQAILKNEKRSWIPQMSGYVHARDDLEKKMAIWQAIYDRKTEKNHPSVLKTIAIQDVDMGTVD